jgi:hypothetical protein
MRTTISLLCVLLLMAATTGSAAATKAVHKTLPLAANGSVDVDTHNGTITVTTWSQPSVDVSARIESAPSSHHPEDVDATNVKVTGGGSSVSIESDYGSVRGHIGFFGFGYDRILPLVHYTIRVPATARLRIDDHNASTHVTGLRGDVRIRSHNGSNTIRDLDGAADVETHNGSIDVGFARFARASRFETHNGAVELTMPTGSHFILRADAHRRNAVSSELPIDGRGGDPELRFTTHNGSLTVRKR